jgi:DNA-binding CsgD family transcriptional regulator/tetratricopeptide (TPR) repeat protein
VGRDAELAVLNDALSSALAGEGQTVLLIGEPGIGKTRTAEQFAATARLQHVSLHWGNCHEWEGAPAFWPWAQVLRSILRELNDDELRSTLGAHGALLAQIMPEIRERLPDIPPLPGRSEPRLFSLLAAAAAVICKSAERNPMMIVVDDVHWADRPSLQLLHFVTQEIRTSRVLLVATYRDVEVRSPHPAAALILDLIRASSCRRITLHGLPKPQVECFLNLFAGRAQTDGLIDNVYEQTAGNPFFVVEVTRLLAEEGLLDDSSDAFALRPRVPESVREAVRRRLDRLSATCGEILSIASVIGRDFDLRRLEFASRRATVVLLDALDEAIAAQLVLQSAASGQYRFCHALVQETLYQELGSVERKHLHLTIGESLEAEIDHVRQPWAELAWHFYQANPLADFAKVCDYSRRAGDDAMSRFDWSSAADHYEHALEALEQCDTIDAERRCELLLALGEAQNRLGPGSGDTPAARQSLARAFELAQMLADSEKMARAAVTFAGLNVAVAFGQQEQVRMLEAALAALGPADRDLRVRVLGRLAVNLLYYSHAEPSRVKALSDEAIAVATRLGDPTQVAFALWAQHYTHMALDDLEERSAGADALVSCAARVGDPVIGAWGYFGQFLCDVETGNIAGAERALGVIERFAERAHIPYIELRAVAYRAMLDLLLGRYAEAAPNIHRARELWQSPAPRQHQAQLIMLLRDFGRLDDLNEEIQIPDESHLWHYAARAWRMTVALERGQPELARRDYEALAPACVAPFPAAAIWYSTVARLTEAAVAFEDALLASQLLERMAPYAGRLLVDGTLAICSGPMSLYLGQLATVLSRWDDAERYFDQALEISQRLHLGPFVIRSLLARGDLFARRDRQGDRRMARDLARRATDAAVAAGMSGLERQARVLADRVGPNRDRQFGLTPRELEVLQLVTEGLSDASIAERLFLSPRTVNSHLTSIYAKLDVSSRTAAARVADEYSLA